MAEQMAQWQALARYRCHKVVQAAKIRAIRTMQSQATGHIVYAFLTLEGLVTPGTLDILVDAEYMRKHNPQVGGYFVLYEDGYQSFSPAGAFEGGYTWEQ